MKKVILITGCSRGLGKALAESLQKENFVYAGIRDFEKSKEQIFLWRKTFPNIKAINLDITSEDICQKAVKDIYRKEKKLDVLINVVGYSKSGALEEFTVEDYQKILDTNAVGAFRLLKEVVPLMKKQKKGRIINITSLNGLLALPNFSIYCSSKFALEALGLSLRYELSKYGVWVTNIEPGAIYNENKTEEGVKFPHVPVRERFWLVKKLLPMVTERQIVEKVEELLQSTSPPAQVLIGQDTKITILLQRYLPRGLWDRLLRYIWSKQSR